MDAPIPADWRQAVCRLLSYHSLAHVSVCQRALREWRALFPGAFCCELFDVFLKVLSNPALAGRSVSTMSEPGSAYEFMFEHQGRLIYGKVGLLPGAEKAIIYSAHRPLKGQNL